MMVLDSVVGDARPLVPIAVRARDRAEAEAEAPEPNRGRQVGHLA
jgi:hypothetical protein